MAQQFEQSSDTGSPLRAQRMTADEARAVIALWQSERVEQTGLTDRPAVPDVAEGLDLTVEDVQRLLVEVRAQREEASRLLAQEQALAEIRLAEEERKLAEIQRQRAELRREQAEAARRQPAARQAETRQASWTPRLEQPPVHETKLFERHSAYKQKEQAEPGLSSYLYAGIILAFVLFVVLSNVLK